VNNIRERARGKLHIGIDATDWHSQRGLGRYLRCLTERLALNPELAITLFSPGNIAELAPANCEVQSDGRRLPWYSWRLPGLVRRSPVAVMFFPTSHAWWYGPVPISEYCPTP
jgi:hypothetical protein